MRLTPDRSVRSICRLVIERIDEDDKSLISAKVMLDCTLCTRLSHRVSDVPEAHARGRLQSGNMSGMSVMLLAAYTLYHPEGRGLSKALTCLRQEMPWGPFLSA